MSKYRYITSSGRSGYYKTWNDSKFSNIPNLMDFLVGELVQIYDADQAGNKDLFIRVKNDAGEESWYVIEYDWYIERDPLRYGGDRRQSTYQFWKDLLDEYDCTYTEVPRGLDFYPKIYYIVNNIIDADRDIMFDPISNFERD